MRTRLSRLLKSLVSGALGRTLASITGVVGSMCSVVPCWMVVYMVLRCFNRLIFRLSGKRIDRELESAKCRDHGIPQAQRGYAVKSRHAKYGSELR